jgi:hypothetical protein
LILLPSDEAEGASLRLFFCQCCIQLQEVFMIHSIRNVAISTVVLGAASGAFAAQTTLEFKTFYDTSTFFNTKDTKDIGVSIATLKLVDNATGGGVTGTLSFAETALPAGSKGLSIDELWLTSSIKGVVATKSGASVTGAYYKSGFYEEGSKFNYDLQFKPNTFKAGQTAQFSISNATVASFVGGLSTDGRLPGFMLEVTGVGKPYSGFLGLNSNLHFITSMIPEPSSYALMALGLAGIAAVARKRKAG